MCCTGLRSRRDWHGPTSPLVWYDQSALPSDRSSATFSIRVQWKAFDPPASPPHYKLKPDLKQTSWCGKVIPLDTSEAETILNFQCLDRGNKLPLWRNPNALSFNSFYLFLTPRKSALISCCRAQNNSSWTCAQTSRFSNDYSQKTKGNWQ